MFNSPSHIIGITDHVTLLHWLK